jgi:hypothetical protein
MYRITIKRNPAVLVIVFVFTVLHEVEKGIGTQDKKIREDREKERAIRESNIKWLTGGT